MSTSGRLTKVYRQAEHICYDRNDRFVIMSDCHRGIGNPGDNFLKNRQIYLAALRYYNQKKFIYMELGDGDELWENKRMEPILRVHREVFELLEEFHKDGRMYMLYGNHDIQKKHSEFLQGISVREGIILEECGTGRKIFLVHGHQGDIPNDALWRVNRFLVRHIWRRLELLGMENPFSAAGCGKRKSKIERRMSEWADHNRQIMIAGHTHRVRFPSEAESYYFNDGSCVHPFYITGIELERGVLRLVRWSVMTREDFSMYIGREVLSEVKPERFDA